ncbi:Glycylpeptide N-tetradecanoyltransferase [Drepanopeziza brunnea f. sp. 'multigermtubi' MB_m1]|uniref:Glycylpeptide N-tetradecanoyltransferase n=1 Tax=Marssonina brunnea f. sp. multigermtubi (strain MB_m1) TaxID=1072389 RepID=K1X9V8_MARBU|nr:Glycylpeptide N-tetradecanoyltransferase [Drepanopeziza brunnea f. sp. 'multigermtubi' MB_m1]EKD21807.1 Glycylpeptide N-tetradecanoyltransferase [Drepanopeziza brunnea f. sp. 'multigermtubi' MB_m1]
MAPLAPIFKRAYILLFSSIALYSLALIAVANPWLQRHVLYVHKLHTAWWVDINKPEQFGFAKNQITPFNFSTPDGETIYAWHVMPLGLYAKHEYEILQQPSGCAEDITKTKAFQLLKNDPDARLIINCKYHHGRSCAVVNVSQFMGYRPKSESREATANSSLSDGSTSNIHILAFDYRGFGLSTGTPTEAGVITDGIAAVNWALNVAQVPPSRIVLLGQSLGTAVTSAVALHFAQLSIDFAGVVLVAGFTSIPNLLTQYSILGVLPILSPFGKHPMLQRLLSSQVVDRWESAEQIAHLVKLSKRLRLFIIHSKDDPEIPWTQSEGLFAAAANATTDGGMGIELFEKMKKRGTVEMEGGAFVSTWKDGGDRIIREEIVGHGQHSRILTYAPVALAALKAFGMDDGGICPGHSSYNSSDSPRMADEQKASTAAGKGKGKGKDKGKASEEPTNNDQAAAQESDDDDDDGELEEPTAAPGTAPSTVSKKKKSKRKRVKAALGGGGSSEPTSSGSREEINKAVGSLGAAQIQEILKMNPSLARQLGMGEGTELSNQKIEEAMKKLSLEEIMTGLASSGKNVKDMASYKFWQTQPVPKFGESSEPIEEGPFKIVDIEKVSKEPGPLLPGFEWVTMDLTREEEIQELFALLYGHYVEDDEAMFRFNYSQSFLRWALMCPGWTKEWHVGIRASASQKLVAFISAIPVALRVRKKTLHASEVNFMCVHKKLRSKRMAPVLIKEITRRCYLLKTWQAIYTGGVVLPKPVSTCRYFHRSLDWQKLNDVGFSPLPANSKPSYQVRKYALPDHTSTKNLRPIEARDVDGVLSLLQRYLEKFDMAPVFTREEVEHWLLNKRDDADDKVVWGYVVEDPTSKKITDFFSFYILSSSVISSSVHKEIRAAYLFYYATEHGLDPQYTRSDLKVRLNELIHDALILAKKFKFDVFNALTLLDNTLFLEDQKFGAGDGQLHYYLYNYNTNPIAGGVDAKNVLDEKGGSGVGVVML